MPDLWTHISIVLFVIQTFLAIFRNRTEDATRTVEVWRTKPSLSVKSESAAWSASRIPSLRSSGDDLFRIGAKDGCSRAARAVKRRLGIGWRSAESRLFTPVGRESSKSARMFSLSQWLWPLIAALFMAPNISSLRSEICFSCTRPHGYCLMKRRNSTIPAAHTSAAVPAGSFGFGRSSGAQKWAGGMRDIILCLNLLIRTPESSTRYACENPQRIALGDDSPSISIFSGQTLRWTTPLACICAIPARIPYAIESNVDSSGLGPESRLEKDPDAIGRTVTNASEVRSVASMRATLGWGESSFKALLPARNSCVGIRR